MSLIKYDLVMSEDEITTSNNEMKDVIQHLDDKIKAYLNIVNMVINDTVKNGKIHENLLLYKESADKLKDTMSQLILENVKSEDTKYANDFDKADDVLF